MNKYRAVNFKSDAEHVSPEFYNLIKRSMKTRIVSNIERKHKVSLAVMFEEGTLLTRSIINRK